MSAIELGAFVFKFQLLFSLNFLQLACQLVGRDDGNLPSGLQLPFTQTHTTLALYTVTSNLYRTWPCALLHSNLCRTWPCALLKVTLCLVSYVRYTVCYLQEFCPEF